MRIGGKGQSQRAVKRVVIPRPEGPLEVTIQALPLGFEDQVLAWLPRPRPPKKYAEKAGRVLKDKDGHNVVEEDWQDPEFQARLRRVGTLQGIAFVHEALRADKGVAWDTPEPPNGENREAFYAAVCDELRAWNFTSGDVRFLIEQILSLGNTKVEDVERAREGFSSEASP